MSFFHPMEFIIRCASRISLVTALIDSYRWKVGEIAPLDGAVGFLTHATIIWEAFRHIRLMGNTVIWRGKRFSRLQHAWWVIQVRFLGPVIDIIPTYCSNLYRLYGKDRRALMHNESLLALQRRGNSSRKWWISISSGRISYSEHQIQANFSIIGDQCSGTFGPW